MPQAPKCGRWPVHCRGYTGKETYSTQPLVQRPVKGQYLDDQVEDAWVCLDQGSRKSLAAQALLADKLKSHGQISTKITYIWPGSARKMYKKVFHTAKGSS